MAYGRVFSIIYFSIRIFFFFTTNFHLEKGERTWEAGVEVSLLGALPVFHFHLLRRIIDWGRESAQRLSPKQGPSSTAYIRRGKNKVFWFLIRFSKLAFSNWHSGVPLFTLSQIENTSRRREKTREVVTAFEWSLDYSYRRLNASFVLSVSEFWSVDFSQWCSEFAFDCTVYNILRQDFVQLHTKEQDLQSTTLVYML